MRQYGRFALKIESLPRILNHAAGRLQQPGTLVKQAADETGFADPFHFSRVFRNVLGV